VIILLVGLLVLAGGGYVIARHVAVSRKPLLTIVEQKKASWR